MHIIQANAEHVADIYRIQIASYPESLHEALDIFSGILHSEKHISYVAVIENAIAGYIVGYETSDKRRDFEQGYVPHHGACNVAYIHDLCVHLQHRGANIARCLLNTYEQETLFRGCKTIIGIAIADAVPFWRASGFTVGEPCFYHGHRACYMTKSLVQANVTSN